MQICLYLLPRKNGFGNDGRCITSAILNDMGENLTFRNNLLRMDAFKESCHCH